MDDWLNIQAAWSGESRSAADSSGVGVQSESVMTGVSTTDGQQWLAGTIHLFHIQPSFPHHFARTSTTTPPPPHLHHHTSTHSCCRGPGRLPDRCWLHQGVEAGLAMERSPLLGLPVMSLFIMHCQLYRHLMACPCRPCVHAGPFGPRNTLSPSVYFV